MKRIEVFGDSIMRGVVCADGWKLKFRRNRKYEYLTDLGYEVNNSGMIGATIQKGLQIIEKELSRMDNETIVLLGFGGNDCSYDWKHMFDAPNTAKFPYVAPDEFMRLYRQAIDRIKKTGARVALCNLVPIDSAKFFNWISTQGPGHIILEWLGDTAMLYRWHEYYNRAVERIAETEKCDLIDLRSAFLTRRDFGSLLCQDGIHPTEKGYSIIDSQIKTFISAFR